jgi:Protein of unknown function (DUF1579)
MKLRHLLFGAALVITTATVTTQVISQQEKGKGAPPEMTPEQQAEMQKWIEFATPGENHALLQKRVGKWNGDVKHWIEPGGEPMTFKASSEIKPIFDGRYFVEEVEGEGFEPGHTFLGKSLTGYDNIKKKFFWAWVDNMGTGIMNAEGTYDPATKSFKYTYDHPDVLKGKYVKGRSVDRWVDDDTYIGEMYGPDKTGKEYKMMEITFKRVK